MPRNLYREPEYCYNPRHDGNGIYGDRLTECPQCSGEAQDAYDDYMETRRQDRED